jgi:hypothetical protein
MAECQQLAKTPTQWLERNTSAHIVEPLDQQTGLLPGPEAPQKLLNLGVQQALAALKVLHDSGISIDEAIRKGQLLPNLPAPTNSDDNSN